MPAVALLLTIPILLPAVPAAPAVPSSPGATLIGIPEPDDLQLVPVMDSERDDGLPGQPPYVTRLVDALPRTTDWMTRAEAAYDLVGHRLDLDGNGVEDLLDLLSAAAEPAEPVPVIVVFEDATSAAAGATALRGLDPAAPVRAFHLVPAVAATLPASVLAAIADVAGVLRVYHDGVVRANLESSTPVIRAPEARSTFNVSGAGVGIAVIDTGVDDAHVTLDDFDDNALTTDPKVVGWYDVINNQSTPYDDHGHGTHVAHTAAGTSGGSPHEGVAPGAHLIGVKVLTSGGWGTESGVIAGIQWAVDHKDTYDIDVISMSLGANLNSDGTSPIEEASTNAVAAGIVTVVAAGNSGPYENSVGVPASAFDVVTVGAIDDNKTIAPFSSRGPTADGRLKPEVTAVGVDVTAATANTGNGYHSWDGTSMATPHVSGVAALVIERGQGLRDAYGVRDVLMDTAEDRGESGPDNAYGHGVVDAVLAVEIAEPQEHDVSVGHVEAPPWTEPGTNLTVNVTVRNQGLNNETNLTVSLLVNGSVAGETLVDALASGNTTEVPFRIRAPATDGEYVLTGRVGAVPGENATRNNERNATLRVVTVLGTVRVAAFDSPGTDFASYFAWSKLEREWYKHGNYVIEVDTAALNHQNVTLAELRATGADVITIPDACCGWTGWNLTLEEVFALEEYVQEGHGLAGTFGTLDEHMPSNHRLAPVFGLAEPLASRCTVANSSVRFVGNESGLRTGLPDAYGPGNKCGLAPLDAQGASLEATSNDSVQQLFAHRGARTGAGAAAYATWPVDNVGFGANAEDVRLTYNKFVWLALESEAPRLDVGPARVDAPAAALTGDAATVQFVVRNFGTDPSPATNVTLTLDGKAVTSAGVPALDPLGAHPVVFNFTVPATEGDYPAVLHVTEVAGENVTVNNAYAFTLEAVTPRMLPFRDNVENGTTGWDATGLWHVTQDRYGSANHSWYYGKENGPGLEDNTYDTGDANRGSVATPYLDLRDVDRASLSFWQYAEGEACPWEHPLLEVTVLGSGTYEKLFEVCDPQAEGTWHANLTAYAGSIVRVRFTWDTRYAFDNHHEGWYVDDIVARAEYPAENPRIPDLEVSNLTMTPEDPVDGEWVRFRANVTNVGNSTAGEFEVDLHYDGIYLGAYRFSRLSPNYTYQIPYYRPVHAGNHTFALSADADDAVQEADETNNEVSARFHVTTTDGCAAPGPDPFGYVCEVVPYHWIDLPTNATEIPLADDNVSRALALPFAFPFYEDAFDAVRVSSNGFLTFDAHASSGCCWGRPVPDADSINHLIAGYWSDLAPNLGGTVRYATTPVDGSPVFVVAFEAVPHCCSATTPNATFQFQLHEDGTIRVSFKDARDGWGPHTTGIEDASGTRGLRYRYASFDATNLTVQFRANHTAAKLPDLAVTHLAAKPEAPRAGDAVRFTATVQNLGDAPSNATVALFSLDGGALEEVPVPALGPGDVVNVTTHAWNATAGRHQVNATVDPYGNVTESEEANNHRVLPFDVRNGTDEPDTGRVLVHQEVRVSGADAGAGGGVPLAAVSVRPSEDTRGSSDAHVILLGDESPRLARLYTGPLGPVNFTVALPPAIALATPDLTVTVTLRDTGGELGSLCLLRADGECVQWAPDPLRGEVPRDLVLEVHVRAGHAGASVGPLGAYTSSFDLVYAVPLVPGPA